MSIARCVCLLWFAWTVAAHAEATCASAAAEAEVAYSVPPGLLLAIGLAESGRLDPATARLQPHAFSINVGGTDVAFASAPYAIGAVAALRDRGVRSIDVGCFQVNLHYHPGAFATLPQAFDPRGNALYAGRFLRQLYAQTGSWAAAVAAYHSADPARGGPYRDRVLRFWRGLPSEVPAVEALPFRTPAFETPLPASARSQPARDPHVIRVSAAAAAIPVYTPATLPAALRAGLGALTQP